MCTLWTVRKIAVLYVVLEKIEQRLRATGADLATEPDLENICPKCQKSEMQTRAALVTTTLPSGRLFLVTVRCLACSAEYPTYSRIKLANQKTASKLHIPVDDEMVDEVNKLALAKSKQVIPLRGRCPSCQFEDLGCGYRDLYDYRLPTGRIEFILEVVVRCAHCGYEAESGKVFTIAER